ncbi:hypothetical protein IWW34DRAFT_269036 [Fusarium oxysporum f. sp. albedinis]|nr:hypothetical protein IWW34DRAFT_269036 [Fusarium oxysporum f. sp. albedinis]
MYVEIPVDEDRPTGHNKGRIRAASSGDPGQDISLLDQLLCWDWGSLANLQTCIMYFVVTYWIFNLTIETLLENHMVEQGHKCQEHQFSAEHPKNTFYTEYIASYTINEVRQKKTGNKDWNLDRMNGQRNYSTMSQVSWGERSNESLDWTVIAGEKNLKRTNSSEA